MRSQLQAELRKVKESLSFQEAADLIVPHFPNAARYLDLEVSRSQFEGYLEAVGFLECLANLVTFARKQSGLESQSVCLVLTGRSSLLPVLRRMLETEFPDCPMVPPFKRPEDAKLVVAHGAALHAAGLVGIRYQQAVRREIQVAGMAPSSPLVRVGEPLPLTRRSTLEVRGGGRDLVLLETAPGGDSTELLRQPLPKAIRQATSDRTFGVELTVSVTEEGCKLNIL
jgi:molecular chaperone DnaK (HSP70)